MTSVFSLSDVPAAGDIAFQQYMLQHVSRTFALTIPQLPEPLVPVVGNAYLLCRIADTIEDDTGLTPENKRLLSAAFLQTLEAPEESKSIANELEPRLKAATPAEHYLIANMHRVMNVYGGFNPSQRRAIADCVRTMTSGMSHYQQCAGPSGLKDLAALNSYCYHVAGVVGEMLTRLFVDYSAAIAPRKAELMGLAASFGQGLQMTNILKDFTVDLQRGICWLPVDVLVKSETGDQVSVDPDRVIELIAIAHGHLEDALQYTLQLPREETGLRKFCLWGIGMAVLTLRKLYGNGRPDIAHQQVKISRRAVRLVILVSHLSVGRDKWIKRWFEFFSRGLPEAKSNPLNPAAFRAITMSASVAS